MQGTNAVRQVVRHRGADHSGCRDGILQVDADRISAGKRIHNITAEAHRHGPYPGAWFFSGPLLM